MSDKSKTNSGDQQPIYEDAGRGLPTTNTKTPMPPVKSPKPSKSDKKS